jgi:hypothetical protein
VRRSRFIDGFGTDGAEATMRKGSSGSHPAPALGLSILRVIGKIIYFRILTGCSSFVDSKQEPYTDHVGHLMASQTSSTAVRLRIIYAAQDILVLLVYMGTITLDLEIVPSMRRGNYTQYDKFNSNFEATSSFYPLDTNVNSAYLSYKYTGKIGKWSCI